MGGVRASKPCIGGTAVAFSTGPMLGLHLPVAEPAFLSQGPLIVTAIKRLVCAGAQASCRGHACSTECHPGGFALRMLLMIMRAGVALNWQHFPLETST